MFKLIIVDPNKELCDALAIQFEEENDVTVVNGKFEELEEFDCMVSAANSFGLMDGGVDMAITNFFGVQLMDRVQAHIIKHFRGEQSVGTSFIIETNNPKHPYLAHTPTMRVPMRIFNTDYVYKAFFACLLSTWNFNQTSKNKINILACPGLGTSCGAVDPIEAGRQMGLAYRNFSNPPEMISWPYALNRQKAIGR
ncbi:MAG: phage tail protein [Planctomycetota bacterium]|nr:MAG: phage tail protein [Planctomycetota bacterium]